MASSPFLTRRGITIIEALIGLTLSAAALLILTTVSWRSYQIYRISTAQGQLQVTARQALQEMSNQGMIALSVNTSTNNLNTNQTSTLIFKQATLDNQQRVVASSYDYLIYNRPTGQNRLVATVVPDSASSRDASTRVLSKNLSGLSFVYADASGNTLASNFDQAKKVKVNLTLSQTVGGKTLSVTDTQTIILRNK